MKKTRVPQGPLDSNPIVEFKKWIALAQEKGNPDFDAMTLATVGQDGKPSARTVLYKGIKSDGFIFFTNYESRKARDLEMNPFAALVFFWPLIYRQIRVEGKVEKLSQTESENYFRSRPRESQIAAWASQQSSIVSSLVELQKKFNEYAEKFDGKEVPCPPFWGGYVLSPDQIEFWVGQEHRLHHRFLFTKSSSSSWSQNFLFP